jgi:hypothetical protein
VLQRIPARWTLAKSPNGELIDFKISLDPSVERTDNPRDDRSGLANLNSESRPVK